MSKGKYTRKTEKRRLTLGKSGVLLAALALLLVGMVTGVVQDTLAYLFTSDDTVENVFTAGEVKIRVTESSAIQNEGNVDAYVRAMVVVTWQDAQGKVYPEAPRENSDYSINWNTDDWSASDGPFYTYKEKVPSLAYTAVLFSECAALEGSVPDGCHLVVDVIAEAVQADANGLAAWNS